MLLTAENYKRGFLVDEELMAGVTDDPAAPGGFIAFVLRHLTGEYLGYQAFTELAPALEALGRIERSWAFEPISTGCGSGNCGKGDGSCAIGGGCKGKKKAALGTEVAAPSGDAAAAGDCCAT